tara:strand:+ start:42725 stop:42907 length:183 start_codon:yes stop_codon:yes gene_type:complete
MLPIAVLTVLAILTVLAVLTLAVLTLAVLTVPVRIESRFDSSTRPQRAPIARRRLAVGVL